MTTPILQGVVRAYPGHPILSTVEPEAPVAASLVSKYGLNSGSAADGTGTVDGTVVGAWDDITIDSMVSGLAGTSMYKVGTQHITLPADQALHDLPAVSVSFYYQPTGNIEKHVMFVCGDGSAVGDFSIERRTDGRLRGWHVGPDGALRFFEGSSGVVATNLVLDTSYRITVTLGPSGARLYLDGTQVALIAQNTNGWNNSRAKYLGTWSDGVLGPSEGVFDHVRVWSGELTASEEAALEDAVNVTVDADPTATVTPPTAPQSYTLPGGGTVVSNASQLTTQLASTPAKDIILADGTYDKAGPWSAAAAHRLWAQNLGGATLTAGLDFNVNDDDAEIHGLKFNVSSNAKKVNGRRSGATLRFTAKSDGATVEDCWFEGHLVVGNAIDILGVHGVTLRRLVITNFTNNGLKIDNHPNKTNASPPIVCTDIDIDTIVASSSQNGQAEFGINAGVGGTYERIRCIDCKWSGIVPIARCFGAVFRDIYIEGGAHSGFYFEHFGYDILLERFEIIQSIKHAGINLESGSDRWNCLPCNTYDGQSGYITIQDGVITGDKIGINVAYGNHTVTVRRVEFNGQCACAIAHSASLSYTCNGNTIPAVTNNVFVDNDYSGMDAGAVPVKNAHPNGINC